MHAKQIFSGYIKGTHVATLSQNIPFLVLDEYWLNLLATLLKMNKLVFLTGLLTVLLFIGTTHGGQFNQQASELKQLRALIDQEQLQGQIQESNAEMETISNSFRFISKYGCRLSLAYCRFSVMDNTANAEDIGSKFSKKTFCSTVRYVCTKGWGYIAI